MTTAKNALLLWLCFFFAGSAVAQNAAPKKLTFGRVEDSTYINDYFGLKLVVPATWHIQTEEFNNKLKERGKEMLSDGSNLERVADIAMSRTFILLTISKYEIGAPVNSNPTIVLVAEKIDDAPGIKIGSDYLFHSKKFLQNSKLEYRIADGFTPQDFGGKTFYRMDTEVPFAADLILKQKYYSTISGGFALSYIVSYSGDDNTEAIEMENIIKRSVFSPAAE